MTWFFIALLVAAGGIWTAYVRSKDAKGANPTPRAKDPVLAGDADDGPRIDTNDPEDLRRWSKELGVQHWDLEDAIRAVGPQVSAVRKHLAAR